MMNAVQKAKEKALAIAEEKELKQKAIDLGDKAVQKLLRGMLGLVSDKTIPYLNRYENDGYLEGSGYFLSQPAKNACWPLGFAKASGGVLKNHYPKGLRNFK